MRRRWILLLAMAGVLASSCTGTAGARRPAVSPSNARSSHPAVAASHGTASSPQTSALPTATSLGPDGVRATWVQQENSRPGTTAWRIPPTASPAIWGYADHSYAADGDQVTLYVSTPAASYHVDAYRVGYYGGDGARLVWRSSEQPGVVQPACGRTSGTNMVSCDNWHASLSIRLDKDFVPGDYLFKLVGDGGQQSYVPLTVWDPNSHAAYLVKNDVLTWQAWNPYGGYDFYAGVGSCPPNVYPLCSRARVVSFDRPYGDSQGAGDFLGAEMPLVQFMEQQGLDVSYVTDVTLIEHPNVLDSHRVLLSLGHDECWELHERQAAVAAEQSGVNMVFLGASPILRHVRMQPSPLGADREEVDYRDAREDPLNGHGDPLEVTGNTWAAPPANWSEATFVGDMYAGFLEPGEPAVPFVVADAAAWIFAGTGTHDGSVIPGVIASDVDGFDPASHPANVQILGHSSVPVARSQAHIRTWGPIYYSDMTYYTDPVSQAGIFASGTNTWIPALSPCPASSDSCPSQFARRVTGNLLHLFGQGPAGQLQPSQPNWSHIAPY